MFLYHYMFCIVELFSCYRLLSELKIQNIEEGKKLPVMFHMLHNDIEIRTQIATSENSVAWLDMDIDDYNNLNKVSIPDHLDTNRPIL